MKTRKFATALESAPLWLMCEAVRTERTGLSFCTIVRIPTTLAWLELGLEGRTSLPSEFFLKRNLFRGAFFHSVFFFFFFLKAAYGREHWIRSHSSSVAG
jgi:hypothetical protein